MTDRGPCGVPRPTARAVLVGEQNPYSSDPRYSLYFEPAGSAGERLCHEILQMNGREYISTFHRYNLLWHDEKWSAPLARQRATQLSDAHQDCPVFVLLGRRVIDAFAFYFDFFGDPPQLIRGTSYEAPRARTVVLLPHPSGRSRAWLVPGAVERARQLVREALG